MGLHELVGLVPVVVLVGGPIRIPAALYGQQHGSKEPILGLGGLLPFGEDEDVAVPAERVGEDGYTMSQLELGRRAMIGCRSCTNRQGEGRHRCCRLVRQ